VTAQDFLLPDLGEGLIQAEIVRWLVSVGDAITVDQPVVEVETAKAVVEIPSPFAGTVVMLHAVPGAPVQVGTPLLSVELATASSPEDGATGAALSERVLVGYGAGESERSRRRPGRADLPSRPRAKPPVRKLAKDLGVDLQQVNGSGPEGLVTREDVNKAAARAIPAAPVRGTQTSLPRGQAAQRIPLRGLRKAIAEKMTISRREIPEATAWIDCDATSLCKLRNRLNVDQSVIRAAIRVSPLVIILRACVAGLRAFPSLNASLDLERGEIVLHRQVNLGVAVHTDRGLLVPVIKDAQALSMMQIAAELARLANIARDGSITPPELVGGTFTVSNYGSLGVDRASPVINFPEAAILGVGRITDRPWVHKGVVTPRKLVQLSISFDHRLCDGADAAGFLRLIADCIEHPTTLLAVL
jgi:2-oxoisovalerate dehydrogenase E2 component (dihydrolipoyl transacylase)